MNSFSTQDSLVSYGRSYSYHRLTALDGRGASRLPYSLKILLENLLRHEDGESVTRADIEALLGWKPKADPSVEIAYRPARVLMQDFTGVPAVVDLAREHRLVVSIEDNGETGGCGAVLLQTLNAAGVHTPFRLHGIPQEFLDHAKRDAILERIGLTPQAIALRIVEEMSTSTGGAVVDGSVIDGKAGGTGNGTTGSLDLDHTT